MTPTYVTGILSVFAPLAAASIAFNWVASEDLKAT